MEASAEDIAGIEDGDKSLTRSSDMFFVMNSPRKDLVKVIGCIEILLTWLALGDDHTASFQNLF